MPHKKRSQTLCNVARKFLIGHEALRLQNKYIADPQRDLTFFYLFIITVAFSNFSTLWLIHFITLCTFPFSELMDHNLRNNLFSEQVEGKVSTSCLKQLIPAFGTENTSQRLPHNSCTQSDDGHHQHSRDWMS